MKKNIKQLILCASAISLPATFLPLISVTSCGLFRHVDASSTTKNIKVTSQQDTEAIFAFKANRKLNTNYLTAIVQTDNSDQTSFTINPKAKVDVNGNKITVTVTYSATNVTKINDTVKFHITFTNSDPKDTWAESITDLTLTYDSPFFDNDFEYTGYLFAGSESSQSNYRAWKISLDESIDKDSVAIKEFKTTTGNIVFGDAVIHKNTTHSVYVYAPYTSFSAQPGDTIGISLTLTCSSANATYEQTYTMGLLAVNELYLMDSKATISTGADFAWYYFYMGLPLGTLEDESNVTVEIIQDQTVNDPMYVQVYAKQLDWENNYFSVILDIKDNWIDPVEKPTVKFDIKISKPDTRTDLGAAGGSAAWNQTFKDVELTFDGDHLELVSQATIPAKPSKSTTMSFNQKFKNIGEYMSIEKFNWTLELILEEDSLPQGFDPTQKEWSLFANDFSFDKMSEEVLSIQCLTKDSWPSQWQSYISSTGSITCYWTARFTSKKDITSSEPLKSYQKQVFKIPKWIQTTFE